MPVYLDTRGNSVLSVAVCDRCNRKFAYTELMPDPNFPGMRVCKDDLDNFDPWRLPARQTENIALRFPRPDVSVALVPDQVMTQGGFTQGENSVFIEGVPPVGGASGDLDKNSNSPYSTQSLNPKVGSVTPATGNTAGGQVVNIFGANFTDIATVKFGNAVASFSLISSTQITAIIPAHVAGVVNVSVLGPFGTGTAINAFTYS
jgi:IPT/TIG domain